MKLFKAGRRLWITTPHGRMSTYKKGNIIHGYEVRRVVDIPTFAMTAVELTHTKTGSSHLHLARDDNNNVFNVLLRTTPMNSSGVAHVLEHVALCGSHRYPVRDPFFKMLNRSMSSFMNAMTGSDYTMYPFSTQHAEVVDGKTRTSKDFSNLLSVYLDSVFFPRIRKMDFLQEGWRLEHERVGDSNSPIVFKGVVFNEMKGLLTDTNYLYGTAIQNHLLPDHTYAVCSGGRPSDILNLTWNDLKNFHRSHYHPSNAKIITYGNLPLESHLEQINEQVMTQFDPIDPNTDVPPQKKWESPKSASISCPPDAMAPNPDQQTIVSLNYLLPEVSDVEEGLVAMVLGTLLTDGPASPFYKSLVESGLGSDYSPSTGYHNHIREGIFSVGLQGIAPENVTRVEEIVKQTIDEVTQNGFSDDRVESVLHRIELQNKHQSSRFGLGLTFNVMPVWQHGADPVAMLQIDQLVAGFRQKLDENPNFLKDKCQEYFKSNRHRLRLVMEPDSKFNEKADSAEKLTLSQRIAGLTQQDKNVILDQGKELLANQNQVEDTTCLPSLTVDDIPVHQEDYSVQIGPQILKDNFHVIVTSSQPTNGVTYFNHMIPIDELREDLKIYVPLFCDVITQVGTDDVDYVTFSQREDLCTGGLSASVTTSCVHERWATETAIKLSSHCLDRNTEKMLDLWQELFHGVNLNDDTRLRTLIRQSAQDLANGVAFNGHGFAMKSASQYLSPSASYEEMFSGLKQVKLMQSLAEKDDVTDVKAHLADIADYILRKYVMTHADEYNGRSMIHATPQSLDGARQLVEKFVQEKPERNERVELQSSLVANGEIEYLQADGEVICRPIRWKRYLDTTPNVIQTFHEFPHLHVNFASLCVPTPHIYPEPSAPALRVAARLLTTKYLHREIREKGGAYGGGARHGGDGVFRFFSYRDPNSTATIDAFHSALRWLVSGAFKQQDIDEAKLAVFQGVDAPVSPCSRGLEFFLSGLTNEMRQEHRERLLAVSKEDLIHAAGTLIDTPSPGAAVIGPENDKLKSSSDWRVD